MKKRQKTVKTMQLSKYKKYTKYELIFIFSIENCFFFLNEASLEHLNVSPYFFFVSEFFLNFQLTFSNHIGVGHFEYIRLELEFQFKTDFF